MKYFATALLTFALSASSPLLISSCASLRSRDVTGADVDPKVRAEQENELRKADEALIALDFAGAEKLYGEFQTRFPNSVYFQKAQFGRAKALESLEQWSEAADLYRKTLEVTRSQQPGIAAQALYELSYCYENLGDEARVLASLKDALLLKNYLAPEQAEAEIPARLAASYNRMGQTKEAEQYFREADEGIRKVRASQSGEESAVWLARTYFHMGVFSTNQASLENLQANLDTLKMVQIFSLRSAEAHGEPWSKMSSQGLIANYRNLWNTIQQIPVNKAMDLGVAKREQLDRQVNLTGQLLTLINELRVYRAPERREESPEASDLFIFLNKLEKQAQNFLFSLGERNTLTPEAEKRGGLKR
jgi:hypothetical protein